MLADRKLYVLFGVLNHRLPVGIVPLLDRREVLGGVPNALGVLTLASLNKDRDVAPAISGKVVGGFSRVRVVASHPKTEFALDLGLD